MSCPNRSGAALEGQKPTKEEVVKMAGAYCMYCDQRCFVYREVIVGRELVWAGHMATCQRGREHDRKALGVDFAQAYNPWETGEHIPWREAVQCEWNAGGDPVSGCDNEAGDDGLCAEHREALRQLEALNLPDC